jgi:hypothetical protein
MQNETEVLVEPTGNQLQTIVHDSGLEPSKAQYILENFQDYFKIAAEWEQKAKAIVVTNAGQKAEMEMARVGRMFLRDKRIAIEKARKELKEQSLREGKAVDGIANVLKALIVPIEEYLGQQENYVKLQAAEQAAIIAAEMERKAEAERIEKEKAEAEARRLEQERIKKENEKLKAEAEERERVLAAEREKAEKAAQEAEAKQRESEKLAREAIRKRETHIEAERMKAKREAEEAIMAERLKNEELQKQVESLIECPFCHNKFSLSKVGV